MKITGETTIAELEKAMKEGRVVRISFTKSFGRSRADVWFASASGTESTSVSEAHPSIAESIDDALRKEFQGGS